MSVHFGTYIYNIILVLRNALRGCMLYGFIFVIIIIIIIIIIRYMLPTCLRECVDERVKFFPEGLDTIKY